MPQVASVRLRYASQDYWFDPAGLEVKEGDHVLVETSKGSEIGLCTQDIVEVDEEKITKPLKPIKRIATEADLEKSEELNRKAQDAFVVFQEMVQKHDLPMSPTAVEFSFDESHATFYFTSEDRVDFRALVRDLSSQFHIRIDMRQVGSRDEARMLGGLGHCGEELCCTRLGGEFQPVSIRMAKEQDLPLNPTKISGLCGRLMCCLRYEFDAYKDFKGRAPKKGAVIDTPAGMAKVVEFDTPREIIHLRLEDGSSLAVPNALLDTGDKTPREGERIRPCHLSQANFDKLMEELAQDSTLAMMGQKVFSDSPELSDTVAASGTVERVSRRRSSGSSKEPGERKPRKRSSSGSPEPKPRDERKRRRSVSATGDDAPARERSGSEEHATSGRKPRRRQSASGSQSKPNDADRSKQASKPRPGQHSSTVSGSSAQESGGGANKRKRRRRTSRPKNNNSNQS